MIVKIFKRYGLYFAWLCSMFFLLGALYFGEILHNDPCDLCWYQRIFGFSLAVILGIAAYRNDRGIVIYAMALAVFGALFAFFHILVQKIPFLASIELCGKKLKCSEDVLDRIGFMTLPMLSLLAFVFIIFFLMMARSTKIHKISKR
jgi:disulfide bond formation protein DsbB